MALSSTALANSIERLMTHARNATEVIGTEGFLAYFEEGKNGKGADAVGLLNELAEEFNAMLKPADDSDSVSSLFRCSLPIQLISSFDLVESLVKSFEPCARRKGTYNSFCSFSPPASRYSADILQQPATPDAK
jgi:hypothetical protein